MENNEAKVAIEESVRRIRSIALVHETLSRAAGEELEFDQILRQMGELVLKGREVSPGDGLEASPSGAWATRPRASMGCSATFARMAALVVARNWAWLSTPFSRRPLAK